MKINSKTYQSKSELTAVPILFYITTKTEWKLQSALIVLFCPCFRPYGHVWWLELKVKPLEILLHLLVLLHEPVSSAHTTKVKSRTYEHKCEQLNMMG